MSTVSSEDASSSLRGMTFEPWRVKFLFFGSSFIFSCRSIFLYFLALGFKVLLAWISSLKLRYSSIKLKINSDPTLTVDLTSTSPPNSLMIFLDICKPRPIPFVFSSFVDCRNPNSLKSFFWSSFLIPHPESLTDICIDPWSPTFFFNEHIIWTNPPFFVNLRAFD